MTNFSGLPAELILCIIEHAAWMSILSEKSWAASLRLINRAIHRLVTRALYDTLDVYSGNFHALAAIAQQDDSPLRMTRRVFFRTSSLWLLVRYDLDVLLAALHNVREFTGSEDIFVRLHWRRQLSSAFVNETALAHIFSMPQLSAPRSLVDLPYLHIIVNVASDANCFSGADFTNFLTQYLVIDVSDDFSVLRAPVGQNIATLIGDFNKVLHISTLKRILIRTRTTFPLVTRQFVHALESWVASTRDPRI
ncbi:hypothetical protein EXIGLDRAFT_86804, partial [Exidia glandulosa HHB12029]